MKIGNYSQICNIKYLINVRIISDLIIENKKSIKEKNDMNDKKRECKNSRLL